MGCFKVFSLCLFYLIAFNGSAQHFAFKHYTVEDGLLSSTVYRILQDHKGFIWMATNQGVCRFDGTSFEYYTTEDGLADNETLGVYEDRSGRIWFTSLSGKPSYYYNNRMHIPDLFDQFEGCIIGSVQEDNDGNLWFGTREHHVLRTNNRLDTIEQLFVDFGMGYADFLIPIKGDTIYIKNERGLFSLVKDNITMLSNKVVGKRVLVSQLCNNDILITNDSRGIFSYSNGEEMLLVPYGEVFEKASFSWLMEDNEHSLWVGTSVGLYVVENIHESPLMITKYLDNKYICGIMEDRERNIWVNTSYYGVYFLPSKAFRIISTADGLAENKIKCVTGDEQDNIWIGTSNGFIQRISLSLNHEIPYQIVTIKHVFEGIQKRRVMYHSDGQIWYAQDGGILSIDNDRMMSHIDKAGSVKSLAQDSYGNLWYVDGHEFYKYDGKTNRNLSVEHDLEFIRHYAVAVDLQNQIWVSRENGLGRFDGKQIINYGKKHPLLQERILDMSVSKNNELWMATSGIGVLMYKEGIIQQITAESGLVSNLCTSIHIDATNNVWVGSPRGISKIILNNNQPQHYEIVNYTTKDGLPSNEVNAVYSASEKVWVATNNGLAIIDKKKVRKNNTPPPIYISHFKIWQKDTVLVQDYTLNHHLNHITIEYIGLTYNNDQDKSYKYRTLGIDNNWTHTRLTSIQYPNLSPGAYQFQVSAANKDGIWSTTPASINFTILAPLWQRKWFQAVGVIVALIGIVLVFLLRTRKIRIEEARKTAINKKIAEAQLTALRAQMNPHFIFNSLNAIQQYITKNEAHHANEYLAKFSRLIRMILEYSQEPLIAVEKEIEALNLYIELESLRFNKQFEYQINVDPKINTMDVEIPPMLIQPYVENSVKHGLATIKKGGKIEISLKPQDGGILCMVEDNGVGRAASGQSKSQYKIEHKSMGMQVTQDRVEILNAQSNTNLNVKIIDLKDEEDNATGTRVELFIPTS